MHPIEQLVVDVHQSFEQWFARGEGTLDLAEAALAPSFRISDPRGTLDNKADTMAALQAAKAAVPDIVFEITDFEIIAESEQLFVAQYFEHQRHGGGSTVRRSLGVFEPDADGPLGFRWLHLQETWITPPAS